MDKTEKKDNSLVTYTADGQSVTLSRNIVTKFLTKGNGAVNDQDVIGFISLCKYNSLNPFLNEAYLVKYGDKPAQMVTSKEAYFKRADACPNFDGISSGIIVMRGEQILELEGTFLAPKDILLGGWAKVYRDDRKYPIVSKVSLAEYDKRQSVWNEKKATMIAKIAKVQALREAFPRQLGGLYTAEETGIADGKNQAAVTEAGEVEEASKEKAATALAKARKAMRKKATEAEVVEVTEVEEPEEIVEPEESQETQEEQE